MNFAFDEDQQALVETLRRALDARAPLVRWLTGDAAAADPAWHLVADDLGALAPDANIESGGGGASAVELAIVAEELGRVVAPAEYVAGAGYVHSLLIAAQEPAAKTLAECLGGRRAVLGADPSGSWIDLHLDGDGLLSGRFHAPIGARRAEALVALAATPSGERALVVADLDAAAVEPVDGIDPSAGSANVAVEALPATVLLPEVSEEIEAVAGHRAAVVVAALALGGARCCLEVTAEYATQRVQFGKAIGSFQAVKHRLASLLVEIELVTSAVYLAACAHDDESVGVVPADVTADLAVATYRRAAADTVQLHGGMGFTWEHPAHLHVERSELLAALRPPADVTARYESYRPTCRGRG